MVTVRPKHCTDELRKMNQKGLSSGCSMEVGDPVSSVCAFWYSIALALVLDGAPGVIGVSGASGVFDDVPALHVHLLPCCDWDAGCLAKHMDV